MDKTEVIAKVSAYKKLLKDYFPLEKVYLFGSYATNTYQKDSDIDVAVVVKRMKGDFFSINPLLWKLRREIDDRIEPILIERDFDTADFLSEVQRYGVEIV